MKKISIVVPMYNESEVVEIFFEVINKVLESINNYQFEIIPVNDGSKDDTLHKLLKISEKQNNIKIVNLSRNFGHESALAAGLSVSKGDATIIMDADLQDPPELIAELISKWEEGYKVVNAKRGNREKDTFMKRFTAEQFYTVINMFNEKVKVPKNVGNYRLLDKEVLDKINDLPEKNRVFRVLVPFVGYKTTEIDFVRPERAAGTTHYNYKSMIRLAIDSITSTTTVPLKIATKFGIISSIIGFITIIIVVIRKLINPEQIADGWTTLISVILLIGGIQILFLGVLGEYIGRIFIETKDRPVYIIDEVIENNGGKDEKNK